MTVATLTAEPCGDRVRLYHPGLYDQTVRRRVALSRAERILERAAGMPAPVRDAMLENVCAIARACGQ